MCSWITRYEARPATKSDAKLEAVVWKAVEKIGDPPKTCAISLLLRQTREGAPKPNAPPCNEAVQQTNKLCRERKETVFRWRACQVCFATARANGSDGERAMILVAHIVFGACITGIIFYWARTDDGRSAAYALLVLGAISTVLVLEMEHDVLIWEAFNRVLFEFYAVGGAAVILVLAWATVTTFIRERRRAR
jgi:hypothetical protein